MALILASPRFPRFVECYIHDSAAANAALLQWRGTSSESFAGKPLPAEHAHKADHRLELLNAVKYDLQGQTFFPPEEARLVFAPLNDPGPAPSTMLSVGQIENGDTASSEPHTQQPCAGGPFSAENKCVKSCPQNCFINSNENALRFESIQQYRK